MGRASLQIVIVLILLNSAAGIITASGLGAALGINPETGGEERLGEATDTAATQVQANQGITDTLFSMFVSTAQTLGDVFNIVFYGPAMLDNLGVPIWLTTPIFAAAVIIVAADVVHLLTGRDA